MVINLNDFSIAKLDPSVSDISYKYGDDQKLNSFKLISNDKVQASLTFGDNDAVTGCSKGNVINTNVDFVVLK